MTESLQEIEDLLDDYGIAKAADWSGRDERDALLSAITRVVQERDANGTALGFAQRAVEDAIYTEDGLDGDTGQRVLHIIEEALTHGTFDKVRFGELPKSMWELEAERRDTRIAALEKALRESPCHCKQMTIRSGWEEAGEHRMEKVQCKRCAALSTAEG